MRIRVVRLHKGSAWTRQKETGKAAENHVLVGKTKYRTRTTLEYPQERRARALL